MMEVKAPFCPFSDFSCPNILLLLSLSTSENWIPPSIHFQPSYMYEASLCCLFHSHGLMPLIASSRHFLAPHWLPVSLATRFQFSTMHFLSSLLLSLCHSLQILFSSHVLLLKPPLFFFFRL